MEKITADWLTAPETQAVFSALTKAGHRALAVGGCVRNSLIGLPVSDIDIATDARPDRVLEIGTAAGFHAVPTGLSHGTVTLVSGGTPHEVTTFRRDTETDGRRAIVAFSTDVREDARRRDFTMNALYAEADGTVIDPLVGLPDLFGHRVRFIEDAEARIKEDYLRILRYFRFHAWYGGNVLDDEALEAIAGNIGGLSILSKERIGAEMLKLLAAPDPAPSVAAMEACGVLDAVLPGADGAVLGPLIQIENGVQPDPIRRLAAIAGESVSPALRLSKTDAAALRDIREAALSGDPPAVLGYRLGWDRGRDALLVRTALRPEPMKSTAFDELTRGAAAKFPISASDLMPAFEGKALGDMLNHLEEAWIESDFSLKREGLLGLASDGDDNSGDFS